MANNDLALQGDVILGQVQAWLSENQTELPITPRKPDVRLIVKNTGAEAIQFSNPGSHSDKTESIPANEAAMVMVQGDTLAAQQRNAAYLNDTYGLAEKGFTPDFLADLASGALSDFVKEAYGPAPFAKQAKALTEISWKNNDGSADVIIPVTGDNAAFGARAPSNEIVFLARVQSSAAVSLAGTKTVAENFEDDGQGCKTIAVGVSSVLDANWAPTGEFTTKPIAPSIAKGFYGSNFKAIPIVDLNSRGGVVSVNLTPAQSGNPVLKPG